MGKGVVGAIAQPISGGLDFASSAFEGIDATKDQLIGRPRAGTTNRRLRLPRAIGGDGKVTAFLGSDATENEVGHLSMTMPHPHKTYKTTMTCSLTCAIASQTCQCCHPLSSPSICRCVCAGTGGGGRVLRRTQDAGGVGPRRKGKRSRRL